LSTPDERLEDLGIRLPKVQPFPGRMVNRPVTVHGNVGYVSGMGPIGEDGPTVGSLGGDLDTDQGYAAARLTAHRMLAVLRNHFGRLDAIDRWLSVRGFIRSSEEFVNQPAVLNGFTDAIVEVFGEDRGICARSAIGTGYLPLGIPIEVEAVVALSGVEP